MKLPFFKKLQIIPLVIMIAALLSACGVLNVQVETPTPITPTPQPATGTPQPPTATQTPIPTATPTQTATTRPTSPITSTEAIDVTTIHMTDALNGWGIGRTIGGTSDMILTTLDGGKSWDNVTPAHAFDSIGPDNKSAIGYFSGVNDAWVFFYNTDNTPLGTTSAIVWSTTDGGQTWTASQPLDLANLQMAFFKPSDINFSDAQHGWLMIHLDAGMMHDYITIFSTSDAGMTWKMIVDPGQTAQNALPQSFYKNGMVFLDANHGWIAGDYAGTMPGVFFYQTTDGGQTWANQTLPEPPSSPDAFTSANNACSAYPPQFINAMNGFMWVKCTDLSSATPKSTAWTYETTNAGVDWNALPVLPQAIGSMFFVNTTTGWFLGATSTDPTQAQYSISLTTDGGKTWTELTKLNWSGQMNFISDQIGWVTATAGSGQNLSIALVQTATGGSHWTQLNPVLNMR